MAYIHGLRFKLLLCGARKPYILHLGGLIGACYFWSLHLGAQTLAFSKLR